MQVKWEDPPRPSEIGFEEVFARQHVDDDDDDDDESSESEEQWSRDPDEPDDTGLVVSGGLILPSDEEVEASSILPVEDMLSPPLSPRDKVRLMQIWAAERDSGASARLQQVLEALCVRVRMEAVAGEEMGGLRRVESLWREGRLDEAERGYKHLVEGAGAALMGQSKEVEEGLDEYLWAASAYATFLLEARGWFPLLRFITLHACPGAAQHNDARRCALG